MTQAKDYIENHKNRFLDELFELLRLPSVSADSAFKKDVIATAELVAKQWIWPGVTWLRSTRLRKSYCLWRKTNRPFPTTVLVYGHYDVQPADPLDLWESDAFDPIIKKTAFTPMEQFLPEAPATTKVRCTCTSKH